MKLKKAPKNDAGKKQGQQTHAKIKAFSRAYESAFADQESSAPANAVQPAEPLQDPAPRAEAVVPSPAETRDSVEELQDTLWTEDRFTVRFVNEDGVLLYTCEVSYGEKPVFRGVQPVKPGCEAGWVFAGWVPEIAHATSDAVYTASFSADPRWSVAEPGAVPAGESEDEDEDDIPTLVPGSVWNSPEEPDLSALEADDEPAASEAADSWEDSEDDHETEPDSGSDTEYNAYPDFGSFAEAGTDEEETDQDEEPDAETGAGFVPGPFFFPDSEPGTSQDEYSGAEGSGDEDVPISAGSLSADAEERLLPHLEPVGKTSLVVSWQPLRNADGYDVYFAPCGADLGSIYRTFSSEESSCTIGGLEKKTVYKVRVRAFSLTGGLKTYVDQSRTLRAITGGSTRKYTDAREVRLPEPELELTAGEKRKLGAVAVGLDPDRQVLSHGGALRYVSGDPDVASVSGEGKVRGISAGRCNIYIIAQNGIHAVAGVTVAPVPGDVRFKKKKYSLKVGKKINLKKKLKASRKKEIASLKWKSSDSAVAKVSKKGVVTALRKGRITVRVSTPLGARAKVGIRVNAGKKSGQESWEAFTV